MDLPAARGFRMFRAERLKSFPSLLTFRKQITALCAIRYIIGGAAKSYNDISN